MIRVPFRSRTARMMGVEQSTDASEQETAGGAEHPGAPASDNPLARTLDHLRQELDEERRADADELSEGQASGEASGQTLEEAMRAEAEAAFDADAIADREGTPEAERLDPQGQGDASDDAPVAAAADEAKAQSSADGFSIPAIDEQLRMVEAMLFASASPLSTAQMGERMPVGCDPALCVRKLEERYASAGVQLVRVAGKWAFRTAPDLAFLMSTERVETRKLSRAGTETLAIIAYHQPVTRAEIEAIRGVAVSRGTIDQLMELEWIKLGRRRQSPGRPVTFVTTDRFLDHFGLDSAKDLPGLDELRQAGLLDRNQQGADDMPVGSGDDLDTDNGDDHEQFADDDAQEKDREKDREKDQGELLD